MGPVFRSSRGFSLIETMAGSALVVVVLLFIMMFFSKTHFHSLNVLKKVDTQENLRLATWTLERAFSRAEETTWDAGALESRSFTGGSGAVRFYSFRRLSDDVSGRDVLLAAFMQNRRDFQNPDYVGTGVFFRAPTRTTPGRLIYVMDHAKSGTLNSSAANAAIFDEVVEMEIREPRVAFGDSLRSFSMRIKMRSFDQDAPAARRFYCPAADLTSPDCAQIAPHYDYERLVTVFLPWNAARRVPFAQYQLPLGGYFNVQ